ncbi:MAG: insulinase family protein [Burkholderiales bacterium]|nr:insulinase family protein [Burkholderiales bacterium]
MSLSAVWRRALGAASFALFAPLCAALPAGVTQVASVEGITEYRLANGLRVVLFPDAGSPTTSVNVTYLVGSRHESYGETGMAHLLEHMVFKGTPTAGNIWDEMTKRGMRINGSTWYDRTNYFETFNASPADLEWAIRMEADRMVNAKIDRKDLDSEMTVVRNEMERGENDPGQVLSEQLLAAAYRWHNYGKDTIGARSDVEGVDVERLRAFYRTYYQPDNAVLVIAGAFDPEQTLGWIARDFGAIPKPARTLPRLYTTEPVQDGERSVTIRRVGDQKLLGIAYHTVAGAHPDYPAVQALASIMTMEPAGRLYKALVDTRKAASVSAFTIPLFDPGFVAFYAQLPVNESLDAAREAAIATLEGVAREPITEAEVARAKARALKEIDDVLADPTRFGIRLSGAIAAGDWRLFFVNRDRLRKVTAQDVQRVAVQYLKPANRTLAQFVPDAAPDRAPVQAAIDVAALVKDYQGDAAASAGELFVATPANLEARTERFTLANGMKVALLPKKTRGQTVKVALAIDQGDEKSLFGTGPQGELAAEMLARGTVRHSRQEIEDTLDRLRAKVDFHGSATRTRATAQTYRDELPDTLRLIAQMLREPSFPSDEYTKLARERLAVLESRRADPAALARRAARRYGNPYPAGDPRHVPTLDEEIALVRKTTVDDARAFHRRFVGGQGQIAIVGDFDADAVRRVLEDAFGTWPKAAPFARLPDPLVKKAPAVLILETPDKASAALSGDLALSINDQSPDYGATAVASFILGEGGASRLWKRIRERDGLSYGVYAYVDWNAFEPNSTLFLQASFAPENRARVAAALTDELGRAARDGFTEAEVADAKASLLKRRHLTRTQDALVAGALVEQAYLGRTYAFSERADAAIAAASAADVNAAFRKYVQPDALALVYAGDFAKN